MASKKVAAMQKAAKKRLAQAKVQLAKFKVKAGKEAKRLGVMLRQHQAALKVALKHHKRSLAAQRAAAKRRTARA
jgi:hypothetical protein